VGGALAAPTGLALLMTQFREGRDRNRAVGLYGAASISGTGLGLILGGLLVAGASWRWIFFVNVPIGLGLLVLSRFSLAESTTKSGRFDLLGALSSTIGMTSLVYGFVRAATNGWSDTQALVAFAAGAALMVAFVFNESRAEAPITPLRLFADRTRSAAYVTRLLLVGGLQGMFFFLSQFLQDVLGYSPISTGIAFLPWIVAVFAGTSFASSGLGERLGHRRVLLLGLAIGTAGVLPLTFLSASSGYPQLVLSLIGWGLGSGLAFIPLTTAGISGVSREDTGAASGLLNVMQQLGGSLGLAILITVFEAASRSAQAHPGTRSSLEQAQHVFAAGTSRAFLVSGIVMAVTLLFAFVTFKTRQVRAVEPTLAQ
jgi:MFS family permease